ncbi:TIGR02678 family protein [Actinoplanes sp. NPDC023714]|uniref:TIGR02678 family protein n=1 Tax=Actinoplanes sp. NPDC023714 TaxID=3154322 RepID=UPI0033FD58E4
MRFAADVSDLELADYQRAVRLLIRNPLITATWPDEKALPRVRRFSAELRRDLAEAFGYRLELHGATARLVRTTGRLEPDRPAVSRTGRPFDRHRYAYLSLCLAALGRAGIQITLSELAESVAADAGRITGLGLDPDVGADRRAFVDAVAWLEERGVLRLADGSSAAWASDPGAGEALYDVARDAVFALFRPPRVLQHIDSVTALLERSMTSSGNAERRAAAQAARRAVLEQPVIYFDDVSAELGNHLRGQALPADLYRLTGLRLERRAEGVLLVDTNGWSAERFPGTGSVAQAAILLAVAIADRVADPDGRKARRMPAPDPREQQAKLIGQIDAGLPSSIELIEDEAADDDPGAGETGTEQRLPFITDSFLREATAEILQQFGTAFGAAWHTDPDRLRTEAIGLLVRFGAVIPVPGGVLARPLIGRYRGTTAQVKQRTLF